MTGVLCGLGMIALLLGAYAPGSAQERMVRVEGRVQWISGDKMLLIPAAGGVSVPVDLNQLPLDAYSGIKEGAPVIVRGVTTPDGKRVVASSVTTLPVTTSSEPR